MTAEYWVYLHFAADDSLLYIGKTCQRKYRQRAHAKSSAWWPQVDRVDHFGPFTDDDALRTEAYLISALDPPHNIIGTPRQSAAYQKAWAVRHAHLAERNCGVKGCYRCDPRPVPVSALLGGRDVAA